MGTFAERLKEYQKKLGFKSVAAFAKAVNVPASTLYDVLAERTNNLSVDNSQKLADFIGISVDELYGKEKTPDAEAPRDKKYEEVFSLLYGLSTEKTEFVIKCLPYLVSIPDDKLTGAFDYLKFLADTSEN